MATTAVTPTYLFPYPTGEDSLSNVAQRIQELATRIEQTYSAMGIDSSFTNLMQNGDAAGGALTGTYPSPTINPNVPLPNGITATTQAVTDSTNKVATTSFVTAVANSIIAGTLQFPLNYISFNTLSTTTLLEGMLVWDDVEGVLMMGIKDNPVPLYVGEQVMDRVTNDEGSTIGKLKAVYPSGSSGNRMQVKLASADSDPTSSRTFGVTTASIADNQSGFTISQGLIKDVNTAGLTEGAAVWLSTTPGELTTTKPVAPNHLVLIGFCVRSHAVNGILLVKIVNGFELDELHDVRITSVANTEILQYDSSIPSWKNISVANAIPTGTITSNMIFDNTVADGDLRQSAGLSVIGRSGNTTGNVADITAGTDAHVLRRSGTTLGFGTIGASSITSNSLTANEISTSYAGHAIAANAAARPASPTIGQIIFQSDTGEFLKWVTDIDNTARWMQVHTAYTPNRNMLHNGLMQVAQRQPGPLQVTTKALTTNVVTLTTATNHGIRTGAIINVALSPSDATFDGTYTVTGTSANTLTYAKTATNVGSTATGGYLTTAMQNVTATAIGGAAPYTMINGYNAADRWKNTIVTHGTYTHSLERDAPTGTMLRNSFKTLVTTANTTLTGAQEARLSQTIEGQNAQVIRKGTANALPTVLSFWVKSGTTGTYIVELTDTQNTRSISQSYTISAANTWEKKVITIPADTTGVLFNDYLAGLELSFWLGAGANYTGGGSLQNTWGAITANKRAFGQTNLAAGNVAGVNYWQLTGVQFEIGTAPSELEIIRFEDDLLRCQRYYYRIVNYAASAPNIAVGLSNTTTTQDAEYWYPVVMRIPTTAIEQSGTATDYAATNGAGANQVAAGVPTFVSGTPRVSSVRVTTGAVLTVGQAGHHSFNSVVGAYLGFNADF